jgi:hypothetical protein
VLRKILPAVGTAALLLSLAVGPAAAAGKPVGQHSFTACWNGTTAVMTESWSGAIVDGFSFGFGDSSGSAGVPDVLAHPARKGSVSSVTADSQLTVPSDATFVTGGLSFRGKDVASDQINVPSGGWSVLPAC